MRIDVRCSSCFRTERWTVVDGRIDAREVVQEGGQRRPPVHPSLAAWRVIDRARGGGPSVVGACTACGQPLCADADAEVPGRPTSWALPVPGGEIRIHGDTVSAPGDLAGWADVGAWAEATMQPRLEVSTRDVGASLGVGLIALTILALWVWGLVLLGGLAYSQFVAPPPPISGGGW